MSLCEALAPTAAPLETQYCTMREQTREEGGGVVCVCVMGGGGGAEDRQRNGEGREAERGRERESGREEEARERGQRERAARETSSDRGGLVRPSVMHTPLPPRWAALKVNPVHSAVTPFCAAISPATLKNSLTPPAIRPSEKGTFLACLSKLRHTTKWSG